MRLVTFVPPDGRPRAGVLLADMVVDLETAAPLALAEPEHLRWDMLSLLRGDQDEVNFDSIGNIVAAVLAHTEDGEHAPPEDGQHGNGAANQGPTGNITIGGVEMLLPLAQVHLLAPLPRPASLRLFDTFQPTALPLFAFGNHGAIYGPDADIPQPHSEMLECGIEVACIIGQQGSNIAASEAASYIAGYTIANGWIARDIEEEERPFGLGAAKARDFALSLGPWLVTPDELDLYSEDDGRFLLTMIARTNKIARARANLSTMHHTFFEMIAYASRDTTLYAGDVLTSGPVRSPWLSVERGDVVELEVTALGALCNRLL